MSDPVTLAIWGLFLWSWSHEQVHAYERRKRGINLLLATVFGLAASVCFLLSLGRVFVW